MTAVEQGESLIAWKSRRPRSPPTTTNEQLDHEHEDAEEYCEHVR